MAALLRSIVINEPQGSRNRIEVSVHCVIAEITGMHQFRLDCALDAITEH